MCNVASALCVELVYLGFFYHQSMLLVKFFFCFQFSKDFSSKFTFVQPLAKLLNNFQPKKTHLTLTAKNSFFFLFFWFECCMAGCLTLSLAEGIGGGGLTDWWLKNCCVDLSANLLWAMNVPPIEFKNLFWLTKQT